MYESQTYDIILQRMIDRVTSSYPNVDTREGSIVWNALAPAAVELAIMYTELDNTRNESFVTTASREYKLVACTQMGIDTSQFDAHAGVFKGEFDAEIEIGSRWNLDKFNYTVIASLGLNTTTEYYEYSLACETTGSEPNAFLGAITPISDYPSSLTHSELISVITEGEDEASDETIEETYFNSINGTDRDGNVAQYETWCSEYSGIGHYKIIPLWNGANTVKVSILSTSNKAASNELIDEFQTYLDPNIDGMGNGKAPIGAFVTVSTAVEVPISVSATLSLANGYSTPDGVDEALVKLFSSIAYEDSQVNYMTIGATILSVPSVNAVSNLKVNNATADITLTTEQIPTKGTTTWTVS